MRCIMGKKVTVDNLASEIEKIMKDYSDDVTKNLDIITKKVGQKGAQALRNDSKASFKGTGKYASGWTYRAQTNRLYTTVTIYNKTPGLPHLLEHGHAVVAGGRIAGRYDGKVHIEPVEKKLIAEYEREVVNKL